MDSSLNFITIIKWRRVMWAGPEAHWRKTRNTCRILVGKLERKRPLGRPRLKWEDVIKWISGN
jgi:hypothetical protein